MGSAQVPQLLDSLIAYLRASVPRLNDPMPSLEQELQLTRAYLELMHMRMPDRLQYTIHVKHNGLEEKSVYCPAMCLLSLVENAIRHGIDPSEEGGRIEITIVLNETRCIIIVIDTGVGIEKNSTSLGTGLNSLHERLQLLFKGNASLTLTSYLTQGKKAEIVFPLKTQPI
jgi:sensor histidine kinase YesM